MFVRLPRPKPKYSSKNVREKWILGDIEKAIIAVKEKTMDTVKATKVFYVPCIADGKQQTWGNIFSSFSSQAWAEARLGAEIGRATCFLPANQKVKVFGFILRYLQQMANGHILKWRTNLLFEIICQFHLKIVKEVRHGLIYTGHICLDEFKVTTLPNGMPISFKKWN